MVGTKVYKNFFQRNICLVITFFQVVSIASYANDDFEMKKPYYEHRKKKACAFIQSRTDPHIEVRIPTTRVVTTTSCEGNVVDFILPLEPKDQALALF